MSKGLKIAAGTALLAFGVGLPIFTAWYTSKKVGPEKQEQAGSIDTAMEDETPDWNVDSANSKISFSESQYQPMPYNLSFENKKTMDLATELIMNLQRDYRRELSTLGRSKLIPHEILQVFVKIDDETELPQNISMITYDEIKRAMNMYRQHGRNAFKIDLQEVRLPRTKKGIVDIDKAYETLDAAVEDKWEAAKERVKVKQEGYDLSRQQYDLQWQREMSRQNAQIIRQRYRK